MNTLKTLILLLVFIAISSLWLFLPVTVIGDENNHRTEIPEGIYIKMTREFYEAIKNDGMDNRVKVYSNNPSTDYLRQISISSRFMVETNLQIIKQQETIIQLLQSMGESKKK